MNLDLRQVAAKYQDKLSKIKMVLFDVDGILTNGKLYWSGEEVGFNRQFHTQDGYGMKILMSAGIKVGVITGGDSIGVRKRFELLGIDYLKMGDEDKRHAYLEVLKHSGLSHQEVLYMGDEFFDLPILKTVGFAATVPTASIEIRESVHYISQRLPGEGCAREVIDLVRHAQKIIPTIKMIE